ncbi:hypothetical protein [Streptomyces sp. cg2]
MIASFLVVTPLLKAVLLGRSRGGLTRNTSLPTVTADRRHSC